VLKIGAAFTLAHSISLALAALQIVSIPARVSESAIALSVIIAAINNVRPVIRVRRGLVAGGFASFTVSGSRASSSISDCRNPLWLWRWRGSISAWRRDRSRS
jgi:hypothetical protein